MKNTLKTILLFFMITSTCFSDGIPKHLEVPLKSVLEFKRVELKKLDSAMLKAEGNTGHKPNRRSISIISRRINQLNSGFLPEMSTNLYYLTTLKTSNKIEDGSIFWVTTGKIVRLEVLIILDDKKMLVRASTIPPKSVAWRNGTAFFMSGWDTNKIKVGEKIKISQYIQLSSREEFEFVGGIKRELMVICPFDIETLRPFLDMRVVVPKKQKEKPKPTPKTFSIWKDDTGKFSVEARFSGYGNGKVTLEKRDGTKITLPMKRLSEKDQEWILMLRD